MNTIPVYIRHIDAPQDEAVPVGRFEPEKIGKLELFVKQTAGYVDGLGYSEIEWLPGQLVVEPKLNVAAFYEILYRERTEDES